MGNKKTASSFFVGRDIPKHGIPNTCGIERVPTNYIENNIDKYAESVPVKQRTVEFYKLFMELFLRELYSTDSAAHIFFFISNRKKRFVKCGEALKEVFLEDLKQSDFKVVEFPDKYLFTISYNHEQEWL